MGISKGAKMKLSKLKFHEISEFEREQFRQKIEDELKTLAEIQCVVERSLFESAIASSAQSQQLQKTVELKTYLEKQMKSIEVEQHLQMLTLNRVELKKLFNKLQKRAIGRIDSKEMQEKILFLQKRLEEEIAQDEFGLKEGFKSFPITPSDLQILMSI